jgi:hypothetical protein
MRVPAKVFTSSLYIETEIKARNDKVRSGIAKRLQKACSYLSDAEFLVLVDKIANVQLVAERSLLTRAPEGL